MTLARVMLPGDANPAGNVHGGTILQLIEQAAAVEATRHANSYRNNVWEFGTGVPTRSGAVVHPGPGSHSPVWAALARVEHMDFQQPMHVGELARAQAKVVYASDHSVAVNVRVWADNYIRGTSRITNDAMLWLVALHPFNPRIEHPRLAVVPSVPRPAGDTPLSQAWDHAHSAHQARTAANKAARSSPSTAPSSIATGCSSSSSGSGSSSGGGGGSVDAKAATPDDSATELAQLMLPSDCVGAELVSGGVIMKLMDNAAGVTAVKHCGTNVVTVSVDAIDFQAPIFVGNLVHVRARPVFVSSRSMEIEVTVEAMRMGANGKPQHVVSTKQAYVVGMWEDQCSIQPLLTAMSCLFTVAASLRL